MNKFIFLVCIVIPFNCFSEGSPWELNIHTASHHFVERGGKEDWNEDNLGVGFQKQLEDNGYYGFGYFKNSLNNDSFYLAYGKEYGQTLKYGWVVSAASGYNDPKTPFNIGSIQPIFGVALGYKNIRAVINPWLVHLILKF